jgi:uncharacterized ion transporter superfamily protein YfcC
MKRNDLLKAIGIGFLILVVLTWFITAGAFSSGTYAASSVEPLGFFNILKAPVSTIGNYATYGLYILAIGGLYGVLKATGAYDVLVDELVNKFNDNRKKFMLITTILFAVLSALTSLQYILLLLVPVFIAVMLELGYSKLSAFMSTFGAILVGNIGAVYGFNVAGYLNYYFSLNINANIWFKLILLVVLVGLLIFFITKYEANSDIKAKVETKVKQDVKKGTKKVKNAVIKKEKLTVKNDVSSTPMIVIMIVLVLALLVACFNWSYAISFKGFETLYTSISNITWLKNIIGTVDPIGYWSIAEGIALILIASLLVGWVYRLKLRETANAFIKGARTMVSTALLASLASIVIYSTLGASSGNNIYFTIENAILGLSSSFNALQTMLASVVGGLFINDFTYFVGYMATPLKTVFTDSTVYSALALIMQTMHGLTMLVLPTSVVLVIGLSYLEIPYKEYLKYIWKFVLEVLAASALVIALVCMFM